MRFRTGIIALTLIASAGGVAAQTPPTGTGQGQEAITHAPPATLPSQLQLTAAQKTMIIDAIRRENRAASPVSFVASVGAPVPPSIELYILPDNALMTVPEAKVVKYTVVQNQVVLVDPTTMRIVDVLGL